MTLEQLRIFVAVAEREHVTQAAQALGLAQSAVSSAVANLETRHNVRLFDRVGRRISLTEAGRALLANAQTILSEVADTEQALDEFGDATRGSLALHASQTIASYWLPRHLVAFRAAHPGVALRLTVGNSSEVAEAVASGAADLGFVEDEIVGVGLDSEALALDQLLLVVGPAHSWALATPTVAQLAEGDWVMREPGSGTRAAFERALAALGVRPETLRVRLELPTNESVRAAVEAGLGATAISASVAVASVEAGLLASVALALPPRTFRLLRRPVRHVSRAAEALLATIRREIGAPPIPRPLGLPAARVESGSGR